MDVVEPEEDSLGDESFTMNHHPDLYEEHDQATNSDVHMGQEHIHKQLPRFDSDKHTPWPSKSHLFHDDEDDENNSLHHHGDHEDKLSHDDYDHIGDKFHAHSDTLQEQVKPHLDDHRLDDNHLDYKHKDFKHHDNHHSVSFEEANSIHGSDADGHPNEGDHPFTEHHPRKEFEDEVETSFHHPKLHDKDLHDDVDSHINGKVVLAGATKFKSHSAGVEEEVASLNDKETPHHHERHDKDIHKIDQDTVAEITKHVVDAVMKEKAKYSKKSKISKKNKIAKGGRSEMRKRTIHNLYVCECPAGFLGAHCQRKSSKF